VQIYCIDLAGCTLAIAVIYGWTGGGKGTPDAANADDLIAIVRMQLQQLDEGPKLIAADLNGATEVFPSLQAMLKDQGWHDVGNVEDKCCKGKAGQATCHTNEGARGTRIDYFFANSILMPAISLCDVDHTSSFSTHRPLRIEVNTEKLDVVANQLHKPTNYAELFEEKVKLEYLKREQAAAANAASEGSSTDKKDAITENDFRKELKHELHKLMDEQIEQRQHRLKHAKFMKDTTRI